MTKEELMTVPVTYDGNRYAPVTHRDVIETIDEYFAKNNIVPAKEHINVGRNGQQAIINYDLYYNDDDLRYRLAFKNSHDGTMSFGVGIGASVMICSNGIVYGDSYAFRRKHTGSAKAEILEALEYGLAKMEQEMEAQVRRKNALKEIRVDRRIQAELLGRMYIEEAIIQSHQLSTIKNQLVQPAHDYRAPDSAWELMQHVTFAAKEAAPTGWYKQHQEIGNFFQREYELV